MCGLGQALHNRGDGVFFGIGKGMPKNEANFFWLKGWVSHNGGILGAPSKWWGNVDYY